MQHIEPMASVVVGKITAVYGIKGWVKVHSFTSPPEGIFNYQQWHLYNPQGKSSPVDKGIPCEIVTFREHGKGFVAQLKGVSGREQATTFCQKDIHVSKDQIAPLDDGDYYWEQLIGLNVLTQSLDGNRLLGIVEGLLETGANDVLEVEPCVGSIDSRRRLIPYVPDIYVKNVDLLAGTLTVDWDPEF
jgi:16S rRNA processing protein RimM